MLVGGVEGWGARLSKESERCGERCLIVALCKVDLSWGGKSTRWLLIEMMIWMETERGEKASEKSI